MIKKRKSHKKSKPKKWQKHSFEFLTMFIAVVAAFALNNWNENRRDNNSENKILLEISNGLEKDIEDLRGNEMGHKYGIEACKYYRKALVEKTVNSDTLLGYYSNLTRDFVSIQNSAGYEALKSKGLELVKNDSLRHKIIALYEYDYSTLRKLEEDYYEMQFQENYYKEINEELAPYIQVDNFGNIIGINLPLKIEIKKRNKLLLYLWKIESNREFALSFYANIESSINDIRALIKTEIEQ